MTLPADKSQDHKQQPMSEKLLLDAETKMTVHPFLRDETILKTIADNLVPFQGQNQKKRDLCAFARAFRHANAPANAVLYHTLDDRPPVGSKDRGHHYFHLLLRTIEANSHLASLVLRVNTGLLRVTGIYRLFHACTSLRFVHVNFNARFNAALPKNSIPSAPWPILPPSVETLAISHSVVCSPTWPEGFIENLVAAPGIRTLRLHTSGSTAERMLPILASQLVGLRLDPRENLDAATWLVSLGRNSLVSLPGLKYLRMYSFSPEHARDIPLQDVAPHLQRLVIDNADFKSIGKLLECLADPGWCPGLLGLPFLLYIHAMDSCGCLEFVDTTSLISQCAQAEAACLKLTVWRESTGHFERLRRRICQAAERHNDEVVRSRARHLRLRERQGPTHRVTTPTSVPGS